MRRWGAVIWALVVGGAVLHNVYLWSGGLRVETNLLALLPGGDDASAAALERLSDEAARSLVVLVGAPTDDEAVSAARQFERGLVLGERLERRPEPEVDLRELLPFRDGLLTQKDAVWLADAGADELAGRALALLHQPLAPRLARFDEDPLQLFDSWLLSQAAQTPVRPLASDRVVRAEGKTWVLLRFASKGPAFALDGRAELREAFERARRLVPDAEVLVSGIPLFAESAAVQANREVSTVGLGSLIAVVVLVVLAFRTPRPLALIVTSVGVGVLAGVSVTALTFERVHLLTLVFGASLVGVAEDYGIHYFTSRQAEPAATPDALLRRLAPGLGLALVTSMAGYSVLAVVPLPGLRQVAVFSAAGLAAAFATVVAWFPVLDRGKVLPTGLSVVWVSSRRWWPRLRGRVGVVTTLVLVVVAVIGVSRARADDDVRALAPRDEALALAHSRVEALLGLPSPAQFFLVRGATEDEVLAREEVLLDSLQVFEQTSQLDGVVALSRWVPSDARQRRHRALTARARAAAFAVLDDEVDTRAQASPPPLTVDAFVSTGTGRSLAPLWGKTYSVVLLRRPTGRALEAFSTLELPGVAYVDRTGAMSAVLGAWRLRMSELLVVGLAVVLLALAMRFGRRAVTALVPTVLAMGLTLSLVSVSGPLTLFHCLGLWILLGTGVDYAIFMVEHAVGVHDEAWFSVGLGAASTFLSFGLLGLSTTPAIAGFGLTVGTGTFLVWVLTPMLVDLEVGRLR